MKKAWHIKRNPQLLLSKVYYGLQRNSRPISLSTRQLSWGCKSILLTDKVLNNHYHWKVGDDLTIGVTTHKWLKRSQPLFRDNTPLAATTQLQVVALILPNTQRWDVRKINKLFEPATTRHIQSIKLHPSLNVLDTQYRPLTKSGEYLKKNQGMNLFFYNKMISATCHLPLIRSSFVLFGDRASCLNGSFYFPLPKFPK